MNQVGLDLLAQHPGGDPDLWHSYVTANISSDGRGLESCRVRHRTLGQRGARVEWARHLVWIRAWNAPCVPQCKISYISRIAPGATGRGPALPPDRPHTAVFHEAPYPARVGAPQSDGMSKLRWIWAAAATIAIPGALGAGLWFGGGLTADGNTEPRQ